MTLAIVRSSHLFEEPGALEQGRPPGPSGSSIPPTGATPTLTGEDNMAMAKPGDHKLALEPGHLMLIHPATTFEDEPLRRHLLTGRIEAVDPHGVRLRPSSPATWTTSRTTTRSCHGPRWDWRRWSRRRSCRRCARYLNDVIRQARNAAAEVAAERWAARRRKALSPDGRYSGSAAAQAAAGARSRNACSRRSTPWTANPTSRAS